MNPESMLRSDLPGAELVPKGLGGYPALDPRMVRAAVYDLVAEK